MVALASLLLDKQVEREFECVENFQLLGTRREPVDTGTLFSQSNPIVSVDHPSNSKTPAMGDSFVESADCFLDELNELSRLDISYQEFYSLLTDRLGNLTSADSVSIWISDASDRWVQALSTNTELSARETGRFSRIVESGKATVIASAEGTIVASPIEASDNSVKLIVSTFGNATGESLVRVFRDLSEAVADIAGSFEQQKLVTHQRDKFKKLESFVQLLHNSTTSLELEPFGYQVTNDIRAFLEADRVWLFSNDGRANLIACSGVNDANRRSETVRSATGVANLAITEGRPIIAASGESKSEQYTGTSREGNVSSYLQDSGINSLFVKLLRDAKSNQVIGVLLVEYFRDQDRIAVLDGLNNLVPTIQSTFANARRYSRLPFRGAIESLGRMASVARLRTIPKSLIVLGLPGLLIASTFFIKNDFEIQVEGELRPVIERHLFAPADAMVNELSIAFGDKVKNGAPVALLYSREMDFELNELQNEWSTARKELQATKLLRTQANREQKDELYLSQLTAQIEQIELKIETINRKVDWFNKRKSELTIVSPIDGQVVTRDVKLKLIKRPVKRGDRLMTIADTNSEWQIVFDVPEREFGYVKRAEDEKDGAPLEIQFRCNSDLDMTHETYLQRIESANSFDEDGKAWVRAIAPVDRAELGQLRVGQTVTGKIGCGRKSLFFIWTRDIRDFLRSRFIWTG